MQYSITFWVLTVIILCYTYINGMHDGCNAIATIITSRAMTPKKALYFTAAIEFLAPFTTLLIGASVASTIKNIVHEVAYSNPMDKNISLIFITTGILAAIVWNIITTIFGIPSSSSHALVGGILGAGIAAYGVASISWYNILFKVVLMIFLTPAAGMIVGYLVIKMLKLFVRSAGTKANTFFKVTQVLNMMFLAFNHSFNDSQKSIGVIMLLMSIELGYSGATPLWVLAIVALTLSLGIAIGGLNNIIKTVGTGIYKVKPIHSFASQLSSGMVLLTSSLLGAPVSTSQIVSSSVMGVGAAERINAVRWNTVKKILFSWFFTIPVVALAGALLFYAVRLLYQLVF